MDVGQHSSLFNQVAGLPALVALRERERQSEVSAQAAIASNERLIEQHALIRWADDGGRWVSENETPREGTSL